MSYRSPQLISTLRAQTDKFTTSLCRIKIPGDRIHLPVLCEIFAGFLLVVLGNTYFRKEKDQFTLTFQIQIEDCIGFFLF